MHRKIYIRFTGLVVYITTNGMWKSYGKCVKSCIYYVYKMCIYTTPDYPCSIQTGCGFLSTHTRISFPIFFRYKISYGLASRRNILPLSTHSPTVIIII